MEENFDKTEEVDKEAALKKYNDEIRQEKERVAREYLEKAERGIVAKILMVLLMLYIILRFATSIIMLFDSYGKIVLISEKIAMNASIVFSRLAIFRDIMLPFMLILVISDISKLGNAGFKTAVGIFYALFLHPVYFIWRAHLLEKKKVLPVIYTICYYGMVLAEFCCVFYVSSNFLTNN